MLLKKLQSLPIIIIFLLASTGVHSQIIDIEDEEETQERVGSAILDDSTKQVYGPTTTRFTFEDNIKYNNQKYYTVDTSIVDLHRYQFLTKNDYHYQNLGNIGTAVNPIFPQFTKQIGVRSGFTLYDPYFRGPEEVKYYDTKSPYSRFNIVWGGQGRAYTEANYSRNIDERSNVGFDFKGLFIDKQIQRSGRGDRHADGTYYNIYGKYSTKNNKYTILGNFTRHKHKVDEYGGILVVDSAVVISDYFDENRQLSLIGVQTEELRTNFHIYQQYAINDIIQIYHSVDRYKQQNDFLDDQTAEPDADFFDHVEVDSIPAKDRSKIVYRLNEIGVKGDIGKTFYNFYYKHREVDFTYKYLLTDTLSIPTEVQESYAGLNLRFGNDSISYISAFGEYLQGGNFKLGGSIRNNWIYGNAVTQQYSPSYIEQGYRGSHDFWINEDFEPTIITEGVVGLNLSVGPLLVNPSITNKLISKYTYFKKLNIQDTLETGQLVLPFQTSSDINLLQPSLSVSIDFLKRINYKFHVIYTNISGGSADAVSVPELTAYSQLSVKGISFGGNLEWQTGADLYWKSSYFADGYDPVIMQFYRQDDFEVEAFPIIDVFVNAKINRGRFFIKLNNVYEIFTDTGYFQTPEYPGQTTILDFGFDWSFYD